MNNLLMEKLQQYCEIPSVSGNERQFIDAIRGEVAPYADHVSIDNAGNLICQKGKQSNSLVLFAHVDHVGFYVSRVSPRVEAVGINKEIEKSLSVGSAISVCVASKRGIVQTTLKKNTRGILLLKVSTNDVAIGDMVFHQPKFRFNKESGKTISPALDNTLGVLAAIEFFKSLSSGTVVFTVQEEIGFHGARAAAYALKPRKAIVLDVTYADDSRSAVQHDQGVSFCVKDDFFSDKKLLDLAINVCKKQNIKYQLEVLTSGNSDVKGIFEGCGYSQYLFIGIPISHMHSRHEVVSWSDVETTIQFVKKFAKVFSG